MCPSTKGTNPALVSRCSKPLYHYDGSMFLHLAFGLVLETQAQVTEQGQKQMAAAEAAPAWVSPAVTEAGRLMAVPLENRP